MNPMQSEDEELKSWLLSVAREAETRGGRGGLEKVDIAIGMGGVACAGWSEMQELTTVGERLCTRLERSDDTPHENTPPTRPLQPTACSLELIDPGQWPAFTKWNPDFFATLHGGRTVPIEVGPTMVTATTTHMTLKTFLSRGRQDEYMAQHPLTLQIPSLRGDVIRPREVPDDTVPVVFIGPAGTFTPLHTDPTRNIFVQVFGEKELTVYPPVPITKVSLANFQSAADHPCLVSHVMSRIGDGLEVALPDLTRSTVITLTPGEAVVIPEGHFHALRSLSPSISVAYWY